jgi:hypothetical protein
VHTYIHTYIHTYVRSIFMDCSTWEMDIRSDKPSLWGCSKVAWPQEDETNLCLQRPYLLLFREWIRGFIHSWCWSAARSLSLSYGLVSALGFPGQGAGVVMGVQWGRSLVCVLPLLTSAVRSAPFSILVFFSALLFHISCLVWIKMFPFPSPWFQLATFLATHPYNWLIPSPGSFHQLPGCNSIIL